MSLEYLMIKFLGVLGMSNEYLNDYIFRRLWGCPVSAIIITVHFQASLGMSREYLINGLEDKDVASYYTYMVSPYSTVL